MYEKYTKQDIDYIMRNEKRFSYNENGIHHKDEEFKQIVVNDKYLPYIISSYGRVFSVNYNHIKNNLKQLATGYSRCGYEKVNIRYNDEKFYCVVHRLVALAFIPNDQPEIKDMVNHINGIKSDNHVWNLEWVTCQENVIHSWKTGLSTPLIGELNPMKKCTEKDIHKICRCLEENKSLNEIYEITGVNKNIIWNVLHNISWKHISKDYDFSKYQFGKNSEDIKSKQNKIHEICKMLEDSKLTLPEIAHVSGVSYNYVQDILYKNRHRDISSQYNIDNFNKYIKNHK